MIISSFEGRIGNNLFQLAACLSLATHHNTQAYILMLGNMKNMIENFLLEDFLNFNSTHQFSKPQLMRDIYSVVKNHYMEKKFTYNSDFFNLPNHIFLEGFFQSEKYFKIIEKKVRQNFLFKDSIIEAALNIKYFNTNNDDFGFIHVRKKDFCNEDNIKIYPPVKIEYYLNCIEESNIKTIYVFSDDIEWCIENIKPIKNRKIIFVTETNPYICLYMMSQLNTAIIANSTFSWWGAWLNTNKNKKVYYPLNWFGPCIYDKAEMSLEKYIKDFICEGWIGR
jgi:hypothetical protein